MIVKRFQNRVAESRIALPVTGVYAFAVCALGGLFTEQLWVQFVLLAVSSFLMMELNNVNALIRIYSRMVSCSFLVLAVMSQYLVVDVRCGIVQACFIAFYLFLLFTRKLLCKHLPMGIFCRFSVSIKNCIALKCVIIKAYKIKL